MAHIDVVDAEREADELPHRIHNGNSNSMQYHRAVYHCLIGRYEDTVDLSRRNHHELFSSRKRNNWLGTDSLYDAWLLSNFGTCRSEFDMVKFER